MSLLSSCAVLDLCLILFFVRLLQTTWRTRTEHPTLTPVADQSLGCTMGRNPGVELGGSDPAPCHGRSL
jgi:hypothetical protein